MWIGGGVTMIDNVQLINNDDMMMVNIDVFVTKNNVLLVK